jgi:hypothetical protein
MDNFTTFNHLIQEYWSVQKLRNSFISLKDKYLNYINEGRLCVISLDCYDLLDWLFPPGFSYHDEHYQGVHNLWKTVEANINTNDMVKLCIPPGSALEMFHIIKHRADLAKAPSLPINKDKITDEAWDIFKKYSSVKRALKGINDDESIHHLKKLISDKTLVSYTDLIDINSINRFEFDRVIGRNMNQQAGMDYLIQKRQCAKPDMTIDHSTYSIIIDMLNLQHNVYLNEMLNKDKDKFCILTAHGVFTLKSWEKAYMGQDKIKPFEHSTIALILTKTMKTIGGVKPLIEFLDEVSFVCNRYINELKKYKPIYEWELDKRVRPENPNEKIPLRDTTESMRIYYNDQFQSLLTPDEFEPLNNYIPKDMNAANEWNENTKQKEKDFEKITQKSKEIYRSSDFLNPNMRSILLPNNDTTDEILLWLQDE